MTDHRRWEELAAGYALHALDPADEAEFEAHLETCPTCAADLSDHEYVAAQLGSISHFPDVDAAPSWTTIRSTVVGTQASTPVGDLAGRRRYAVSRRVLAVAAAVVLVAGGLTAWQVASGGSGCSASAGCHTITLDAGKKAVASVVVRNERVTIEPTAMPPAPAGKVYVLWQLPRNGTATAIAEFSGAQGNSARTSLKSPYSDTAAFAVSLEHSGPPPVMPSNTLASGTAS
ncbi:MAG TPA: anti-sigma factor [Mycobacteriales bacterium]|nr:anti-sigma factor [Mycobacteriales bacterium]